MLQELLTKYKSRNPFAIANFLNITILYEELGSIKGYFNKAYGCKFIHINQNLPEKENSGGPRIGSRRSSFRLLHSVHESKYILLDK